MKRLTQRFLGTVVVPATVFAGLSLPAQMFGATSPSLAGEGLHDDANSTGSVDCGPNASGSFTWHSTGTATGDYAGTYVVDGSATVLPTTSNGRGAVTSFSMSFTITSPTALIVGTESLSPGGSASGSCDFKYPVGAALGFPQLHISADTT